MARQVKCPRCEKLNNKEHTVQIGNRYYCIECSEIIQKEKENKRTDWEILFNYICEIYNIERPTGMMFKQLKDFRNEPYNYTDSGMYATLRYYYETLENEVIEGTGLGIIPYYYEKAKQHYIAIYEVEDNLENYKEINKKEIKIDLSIRNDLTKKMQLKRLDYTDIDWGEDDDREWE